MLVQFLVKDRWIMMAMIGENIIFVGHIFRVYGGSKKVHGDNWQLTLVS